MAFTKGEAFQIAGRAMERIGKKLDDPETPNELTKEEIASIIQETLLDVLAEYND